MKRIELNGEWEGRGTDEYGKEPNQNQNDLLKIAERMKEYHQPEKPKDTEIQFFIQTQMPDGSWTDIDYQSNTDSACEPFPKK